MCPAQYSLHCRIVAYRVKHHSFHFPIGADSVETVLHTEDVLGTPAKTLHHFHLRHGDRVTSEVNVTNQARLSTEASSDGFTVDLTDPEMRLLHDGQDENVDQQYTVALLSIMVIV